VPDSLWDVPPVSAGARAQGARGKGGGSGGQRPRAALGAVVLASETLLGARGRAAAAMPSSTTAVAGDALARDRAPVSPATPSVCEHLGGCRDLGPMLRVSKVIIMAVLDIR
jgi:hypothetical protein